MNGSSPRNESASLGLQPHSFRIDSSTSREQIAAAGSGGHWTVKRRSEPESRRRTAASGGRAGTAMLEGAASRLDLRAISWRLLPRSSEGLSTSIPRNVAFWHQPKTTVPPSGGFGSSAIPQKSIISLPSNRHHAFSATRPRSRQLSVPTSSRHNLSGGSPIAAFCQSGVRESDSPDFLPSRSAHIPASLPGDGGDCGREQPGLAGMWPRPYTARCQCSPDPRVGELRLGGCDTLP